MAITTCISGNSVKTRGNAATIVQAGTPGSTENSNLSLRTLSQNKLYNHVYAAVSANSSGNLGTIKPYSAGSFAYQARGQYIMKMSGKYISGVATNIMLGGANFVNQRPFNKQTTQRTSFLYSMTWTASRNGQPVYTSTTNNHTLDLLTDDATLDIAEFAYRTGKPLPTQADYQTKYSN